MTRPRRTIDTAAYVRFTARIINGAGKRLAGGDAEDLAQLVRLRAVVDDAIVQAVQGMRESGATWADIGEATGTSRQAAFEKWAKAI